MKKCPYCAEDVQSKAKRCRYCQSWLTEPVPRPLFPPGLLTRSQGDRVVAGVCGGIANYFGIDPTIVRVVYALAVFFTAIVPGLLAYLLLIFLIPNETQALADP